MTRMKNRQTGFGIVEALIVVLAVGVLAGAGWFVYQHNRTKLTQAAAGSQQTTTTPPAPTVAYLTIKEWGIKLPLADSVKDAYYVSGISSKDSTGQPNQMWLGLTSLDTSGCAATNNSGIAMIFRARPTDTDPVSGELITTKYPNGVTIGTSYYAVEDFTANLAGVCTAAPATLQAANAALVNTVKSAVAATAN